MDKKKLLDLIARKEARKAELNTKASTSEDVAELRSINTELDGLNNDIAELRSMVDAIKEQAKEEPKEEQRGAQQQPQGEMRAMGSTFNPAGTMGTNTGNQAEERAAKELEEVEKRGRELKEGRSVTVASTGVVLHKHTASDINPTFNVLSSLVDRVSYLYLPGGESFTQPFVDTYPEGDYSLEGAAFNVTDVTFGSAAINKTKITSYSENSEELLKLTNAPYEAEIMKAVRQAIRIKMAKQILVGTGAANTLMGIFSANATAITAATDIGFSSITNTTLDTIKFSFGGAEEVEDQAVLILSKDDLAAFSRLRTTDGKPFHSITIQGNTGNIDGTPFIINSACLAVSLTGTAVNSYAMAYGPLSNYKLCVFSDIDVQRSTDFKFSTGMIAHRASVFVGGNVVHRNGFLRVKKVAAS